MKISSKSIAGDVGRSATARVGGPPEHTCSDFVQHQSGPGVIRLARGAWKFFDMQTLPGQSLSGVFVIETTFPCRRLIVAARIRHLLDKEQRDSATTLAWQLGDTRAGHLHRIARTAREVRLQQVPVVHAVVCRPTYHFWFEEPAARIVNATGEFHPVWLNKSVQLDVVARIQFAWSSLPKEWKYYFKTLTNRKAYNQASNQMLS
jgi:hypothetical protein